MKMNRTEFKALVKECLVELLTDGLGDTTLTLENSEHRNNGNTNARRPNKSVTTSQQPSRPVLEAVKRVSAGNGIMDRIFADTAVNTLPTLTDEPDQGSLAAGPIVSPDAVSQAVSRSNPSELFGDDSVGRWASLAFTGSDKNS